MSEEIDKYYSDNYYKLVRYLMNRKRGGDKVNVISDDAINILHDCYCYHKSYPEHFDEKYIWNLLKQRRMNYLRDKDNYNSMKDEFFKNFYSSSVKNVDGLDVGLSKHQMSSVVKQEIREVKNLKHKEVLTNHILNGNGGLSSGERNIVERFKNKLVEKYGEESDQ